MKKENNFTIQCANSEEYEVAIEAIKNHRKSQEKKALYELYAVGCDVDSLFDEGKTCNEVLAWFKSDEAKEAYEDDYNKELLLITAEYVIKSHIEDGYIGEDGRWKNYEEDED